MTILTGLDRFIATDTKNPIIDHPEFDYSKWIESVQSRLGFGNLTTAVFWPPQADRGRVYVHLFDSNTHPVGFAKISFDAFNDGCLENEAKTLSMLGDKNLQTFRIPRVLDFQPGSADQHATLVTESIPADATPLDADWASYPSQCAEEIRKIQAPVGSGGFDTLSWWPRYLDRSHTLEPDFVRELAQACPDKVHCCRIHGDFGITNVVKGTDDTIWIFDWEESCQDGPVLADELSYFLRVHSSANQTERDSLFSRFQSHFLDENVPQRRIETMLALAFGTTVNALKTDLIISRWNQLSKGLT